MTMGLDLGKSVARVCTNTMRRTDSIGSTAKPQNEYVFVRELMRAHIRFRIHEGQREKRIERKE